MDTQTILVEPRSERNGLFPEEQSLKSAIKELNDRKLTYRGYTALYENKDINPMIAGKRKKEMEELVHKIHCRYVKYLAIRDFLKPGFTLKKMIDENEQYQLVFTNDRVGSEIVVVCDNHKWLIQITTSGIPPSSPLKFLSAFQARIGKIVKTDE
ncbi:MAG: hypothetical protein ACW97Z_10580 [Candidatus Hodarchaeales archaeon]|jgi:hypothetical protein